jgi:hypothetical protein
VGDSNRAAKLAARFFFWNRTAVRTLLAIWAGLLLTPAAPAAERVFEFTEAELNKTPTNFSSVIAGLGQPGDWRIVLDDAPPSLMPLSTGSFPVNRRPVLSQQSRSIIDTHYPILVYDGDTYADFRFSTRFKILAGETDQMAGIVFRFKDEKNFYVLRASVKDGTLRFYRMNNGIAQQLIGPKVEFKLNEWRELAVECKGTEIRCFLDGKEAIPLLNDSGLSSGKVGFWTKSDTVAHFTDARVRFTPKEPAAQTFVRDALQRYPRVVGLRIAMPTGSPAEPRIIASKEETELGQAADKASRDVLRSGRAYFGRERGIVHVTLPLRDRNGETIAAVKVTLDSFPGQTEQNAIIRAQPVLKIIQARVTSPADLIE